MGGERKARLLGTQAKLFFILFYFYFKCDPTFDLAVKRVMIDGTERLLQRPQAPEAQTANDSGKKKRHPRNQLAAVDAHKRVCGLSKAREGKVHDQRCHDEGAIAGAVRLSFRLKSIEAFWGCTRRMTTLIDRTANHKAER